MTIENDFSSALFHFANKAHELQAQLFATPEGTRLIIYGEDGDICATFTSSITGKNSVIPVVLALLNLQYVRMVNDDQKAA